jgi:hypothetical protein
MTLEWLFTAMNYETKNIESPKKYNIVQLENFKLKVRLPRTVRGPATNTVASVSSMMPDLNEPAKSRQFPLKVNTAHSPADSRRGCLSLHLSGGVIF